MGQLKIAVQWLDGSTMPKFAASITFLKIIPVFTYFFGLLTV